jgi:hypothetical protein
MLSIGTQSMTAAFGGDSRLTASSSAVLSQVAQSTAASAVMATDSPPATMSSTAAGMGPAPAGTSGTIAAATVVDLVVAALGDHTASTTPVENLARDLFAIRSARLRPAHPGL